MKLSDLLDVRGTLAIANEEKVVNVKCLLGQQLLSVARTSPWRSNHKGHPILIKARLCLGGMRQKTLMRCKIGYIPVNRPAIPE